MDDRNIPQARQSGNDLDHLNMPAGTPRDRELTESLQQKLERARAELEIEQRKQFVAKQTKPEPAKELTKDERIAQWMSNYQIALEHGSPRTSAEFAELRHLLGIEGRGTVKLNNTDRTRLADALGGVPRIHPFDAAKMKLEVGAVVPADVRTVNVPVIDGQEWDGHTCFAVSNDVFVLDAARKIVAIIDLYDAPDEDDEYGSMPAQTRADINQVNRRSDDRRSDLRDSARLSA